MATLTTSVEIRLDAESLEAIKALTDAINRMSPEEEAEEPEADEPAKPAPIGATAWRT
jgi:hypothetical protein